MNVLYFWASTLQNKALSNKNKGHLGSRYRYIYIANWIIKVSMAILTLEYESLLGPRQAANAAGNVWTAFNAWHGWPWRGHWRSPSWMVPWCKAPKFLTRGRLICGLWMGVFCCCCCCWSLFFFSWSHTFWCGFWDSLFCSFHFLGMLEVWPLQMSMMKLIGGAYWTDHLATLEALESVGSKAEIDHFLLQTSWNLWICIFTSWKKTTHPTFWQLQSGPIFEKVVGARCPGGHGAWEAAPGTSRWRSTRGAAGRTFQIHPRNLTARRWKMGGWKTILSYWVSVTFQGRFLLNFGRVRTFFRTDCILVTFLYPLKAFMVRGMEKPLGSRFLRCFSNRYMTDIYIYIYIVNAWSKVAPSWNCQNPNPNVLLAIAKILILILILMYCQNPNPEVAAFLEVDPCLNPNEVYRIFFSVEDFHGRWSSGRCWGFPGHRSGICIYIYIYCIYLEPKWPLFWLKSSSFWRVWASK